MDVAIDGPGFFVVNTPNGERYTRGGTLRIDEKHQLVDIEGRPLLGVKKNGPLTMLDGPVEISKTGDVTQNGQVVDTLRMEAAPKDVELAARRRRRCGFRPRRKPAARRRRSPREAGLHGREQRQLDERARRHGLSPARVRLGAESRSSRWITTNETITTQLAKPL